MLRKERLREAGKHGGGGRLARGELGSGGTTEWAVRDIWLARAGGGGDDRRRRI